MYSGTKTAPWLLAVVLAVGAGWWSSGVLAVADTPADTPTDTPAEDRVEPGDHDEMMPPLPPDSNEDHPRRFRRDDRRDRSDHGDHGVRGEQGERGERGNRRARSQRGDRSQRGEHGQRVDRAQRGGRGQPPGPWMWHRMSDEERQELRKFMAEVFPERFDEMADLEDSNHELFTRMLGRIVPEMIRLKELRDNAPEAFEVRVQEMKAQFAVRRLARRYRFTDNAGKKQAMEAEIRELAAKLFDLRNAGERLELGRLEKRLDHMQNRIAEREENREENIDRLVQDILSGRRPRNMDRRPGGPGGPGGVSGPDGPGDRLHAVPDREKKKRPGNKSRRRHRSPQGRDHHDKHRNDRD